MITAFCTVPRHQIDAAFTGELAARRPGAWNARGARVVYLAGSRAVATVELLARFRGSESSFVLVPVEIPDELVIEERAAAPDSEKARDVTRAMGAAWLQRAASAVLRIPSGTVRGEHNFVANPGHADFRKLRVGRAEPFLYDLRSWR